MATIPQYEAGVPFQPAPVVSSAPVWEEASALADKMAKSFGSLALKDKETKILADKYNGASAISNQSTKAFIDASKNPNPAQGMEQYNAAMNGIAQSIKSTADPANIPYLNRLLTYQTNKINLEFARQEAQQTKSLAYVQFSQNYNTLNRQMSNAAYNGDQKAAMLFHGQVKNMIDEALTGGYLGPTRAAIFQKGMESEFRQSVTLGQYRAAIENNTQKDFRKKFIEGNQYNKWFDISEKSQMLHQFDRMDKENAANKGVNFHTYELYKKQFLYDVQNGRPVDQGMLANLTAVRPKEAINLLNDLRNAEQQYQIVSSAKHGNLVEIHNKINELEDVTNVPKNVNDAANNRLAALQLRAYLNQLKTDPVTTIKTNPAYQEQSQKNKADGKLTPTQLNIEFQRSLGFPDKQIHALDNATALQAATAIGSLPINEQIKSFDEFLDSHAASSRPYIIKDLQRNGLPLATQYLYRISKSDDPTTRGYAIPAALAWQNMTVTRGTLDSDKSLKQSSTATRGTLDFDKSLKQYSAVLASFAADGHAATTGDLIKYINADDNYLHYGQVLMSQGGNIVQSLTNFRNHAALFAIQLLSNGRSGDLKDAISQATKAMLSGLTMTTFKGNTIAYDSSIPSSLLFGHLGIGGILRYVQDKIPTKDVVVSPTFKNTYPMLDNKQLQARYLAKSSYITTPDQSGLQLVDEDHSPIRLKNGKQIEITWDVLKNHNSELMKSFAGTTPKKSIPKASLTDFTIAEGMAPISSQQDNALAASALEDIER